MATYGHDEKNNRIETMTKEEIYALLAEAIQEGQLPQVDQDTAFVTMIKSIVDGNPYKIGFCTQAQYNQLEAQGLLEADALYIITDDAAYSDLVDIIDEQQQLLDYLNTKVEQGIKNNLTGIDCAFDFSYWNSTAHQIRNDATALSLKYNATYGNNRVSILPVGAVASITSARVEYVSGDDGYIYYTLDNITTTMVSNNYIELTANKANNAAIANYAYTSSHTAKSTTFKLIVQGTYGEQYEQEFTINYYGYLAS